MKKLLFTCFSMFIAVGLIAQCSDLFISEYVEGSNNNKAIEIYNPTPNAINLSEYAIGRFRNGSTSIASSNGTPVLLPNIMLESYDTYVIVIDQPNLNGTGQDAPVWNGYNVFETGIDSLTNETIIDFCTGEPELFVQYVDDDNGNPFEFGTTYQAEYDLAGKADTFICPVYELNNHMYYNGNDAVVLMRGTTVESNGSNLIDVIGVIGEDPVNTIGQPAWVDNNGRWLTRDITIGRRAWVEAGSGPLAYAPPTVVDTMAYVEWDYFCTNHFIGLGSHGCECDPDYVVGTQEVINQIPVTVQPNPTNSWLLVNAPQSIQQIEIYDLAGRQIFQQEYDNFSTEIRLSVHDYHSGIYMVNVVFDNNQRTVKKFVVR